MIPVVTVEFDPTSYTVNENAGTVRFVIVKRESSTSDIMVLFSTRNDSATGIIMNAMESPNNGHTWDPPRLRYIILGIIGTSGIKHNARIMGHILSIIGAAASLKIKTSLSTARGSFLLHCDIA